MLTTESVEQMISTHGGVVIRKELTSRRYHQLLEKVAAGDVVRIRRGVFALPSALSDTMYDMDKIVPGGVLCNYSAWSHYGLTMQIPLSICVAIERKRKVVPPAYPPITFSYQSKEQLALGRVRANVGGHEVYVFDMERSVCDALKSRNKIGMDVCSEIINNYLRRKDRDLDLLARYAKVLRVGTVLRNYLELAL